MAFIFFRKFDSFFIRLAYQSDRLKSHAFLWVSKWLGANENKFKSLITPTYTKLYAHENFQSKYIVQESKIESHTNTRNKRQI